MGGFKLNDHPWGGYGYFLESHNKNGLKHYENNLKQLKTASINIPWAYIQEGLLSGGFLRLRFGGLIFGRAYFFFVGGGGGLLSEFYSRSNA